MEYLNLKTLVNVLVYSVLGVLFSVVSFVVVDKFTPVNLWREITQEKNVAVAIMAAAIALGLSIIVAAAIHG